MINPPVYYIKFIYITLDSIAGVMYVKHDKQQMTKLKISAKLPVFVSDNFLAIIQARSFTGGSYYIQDWTS